MWFKRVINSFLGVRTKHELENDLKHLSLFKIITLFIILNITFISILFFITTFFINSDG
ncbi:DUF2970 domain-containing protein [Gammaproteobacteria bacterium]|nr:DUF2970 domain-containing protein [Gammaproteobacteria bacterium]